MMKMFVQYYQGALKSLRNAIPLPKLRSMQVISKMLRSKFAIKNEDYRNSTPSSRKCSRSSPPSRA